eukprot:gene2320-2860_t
MKTDTKSRVSTSSTKQKEKTTSSSSASSKNNERATTIKDYLMALRPWSLTIATSSILVGTALAYKIMNVFDPINFAITLVGGIGLQCFGNVINSYYDYKSGVDTKEKSADRTMFDFTLSPQQISNLIFLIMIVCLSALGALSYRLSFAVTVEHLLPLCAVGSLLMIFYTATPFSLKYRGLGDITIILCFGPLLVQGAFISQTYFVDQLVYLYSIPLALVIEAILHVNNTRDIETDRKAGANTIASKIGFNNCLIVFILFYFVAYSLLGYFALSERKVTILLPFIVVVKLFKIVDSFRNQKWRSLDEETAIFAFMFGVLNAIGFLFSL